jgi:hypothetical protein
MDRQVNGSAVTFPYDTNQSVTSIGGGCTTGDGNVSWTVSGPTSANSAATCTSGSWSAPVSLSSLGTYTLSATQTNTAGTGASGNQSLTISDLPPIASFTFSPSAPLLGQLVTFNGSGSSDPDGTVSSYSWSFGDGSSGATGVSTTHSYTHAGTFTVQLSVTDNSGSVAATARSLTVSPAPITHPPVIKLRIAKQRLGWVLKHGLLISVTSNQSASAKLLVVLRASDAKRLGLGNGKRAVTIATATRRLAAGKTTRVTLKLTRQARSRLGKVTTLRVTVSFAATATGGKTTVSQRLLLRR